MDIPASVQDFTGLIRWIAKRHHKGKYLPIASKARVSAATVHLWAKGVSREPKRASVLGLSQGYGLDPAKVFEVIDRGNMTTAPVPRTWDDGCTICDAHQAVIVGEERERRRPRA